jgi:16S rRNA (cytosine1402-N4)-methyltransferase
LEQPGILVDATFGGGGHSAHILSKMADGSQLFAFDQDTDALKNAEEPPFAHRADFHFVASNFRHLKRMLRAEGIRPGTVSAILADLGVSSFQLDTPERGFSYRYDAPLDMRMNTSEEVSAATVLNTYSAAELQRVFGELGEVRNAKTFAQACVEFRVATPFSTTGDLVRLCDRWYMGDRMRYLSQVFQALRMEVNEEVQALKDFLEQSLEMLEEGGVLIVLTYHSIEDRYVKHYLKAGNFEGEPEKDFFGNISRPWDLVNKKPVEATEAEIKENPRARSAKLRVAEKRRK